MWKSLSFSACGLHVSYQVGVAKRLLENGVGAERVYCSSGGCATAIYFLLDLRHEIPLERLLGVLPTGRKRRAPMCHAWCRSDDDMRGLELARHRFLRLMGTVLDHHPDAYQRLSGRMYVYVSAWPWMHSRVICRWNSNEELMRTVKATTCIPGIDTHFHPVWMGWNCFVDGGFVTTHPIYDKNTVCVSTQKITQWWSRAYREKKSKWPEICRCVEGEGSLEVKPRGFYRCLFQYGEHDAQQYLDSLR